MKKLFLRLYLVIAALFGIAGNGFANDLLDCSKSRTFQNCNKTNNSNVSTKGAKEYSLLIEEDGDTFMFIIHLDDGFKIGKIATFGGFEWFKKTFNNLDDAEIYVQPAHLRISGNLSSYIQSEYEVSDISYEFTENSSGDHFLNFESKKAISDINSFILRNDSFSFAGWSGRHWYAGTFSPVNDISDLLSLAKTNLDSLCFLIDQPITQGTKNKTLNVNNLAELMREFAVGCDGTQYLM